MKRLFTLIVAISSIFAALAQNPMVTLSHNGELTFFTNLAAFQSAVEAAEDGDILYLSEGDFILNEGKCDILKQLTIIGSGYKSHILGLVSFNLHNNTFERTNPLLLDGVRLESLEFSGQDTSVKHLGETEIRRSWIETVYQGDAAGTNALYENCYITTANFDTGFGNVLLKNSKINKIDGSNSYNIDIKNCNINGLTYYPRNMISSILDFTTGTDYAGPSTLLNCLLHTDAVPEDVKAYDCYFVISAYSWLLDENLNPKKDITDYKGTDGKVVGVTGGDSPFSENPSVPTVDTEKSSVDYDAASNKLKVSITVKAD